MLTSPPKAKLSNFLGSFYRDPLEFYLKLSQQDDIVCIPGRGRSYLINQPEFIQHILQKNSDNYTKKHTSYDRIAAYLGHGLLTTSGEQWHKQRQQLQPLFLYKNLIQHHDFIVQSTNDLMNSWEPLATNNQVLNIAHEMMKLVLTISAGVFFGMDCSKDADNIIDIVHKGNRNLITALSLKPWFPSIKTIQFHRVNKKLNQLISDIIQQHPQQKNLVEPLLEPLFQQHQQGLLIETEFIDNIKNLFVAGHETTGNALAWTLYCLSRSEPARKQLDNELHTVLNGRTPTLEDLSQLTFTQAVIEEALRLFPPIWILDRRALKVDTVNDYLIEPKSLAIISPYTMHRNPQYWPQPNEFLPERFLSENRHQRHKCAYIPFGTGPRVCIGKQMAMMITKIALAMINQRYAIELDKTKPVTLEPLVTLKPLNGLWMRVQARHE